MQMFSNGTIKGEFETAMKWSDIIEDLEQKGLGMYLNEDMKTLVSGAKEQFYNLGIDTEKSFQLDIDTFRAFAEHDDSVIVPTEQEQIVSYKYLYCGTLDMIGKVQGLNCLLDIKFTAELDKEYLSWQLGMYQLAKGIKYDKCYCIWLPKRELGQLVEIIPKTKKEILEKLEELKIWNK